jgi:beta-galactosidase
MKRILPLLLLILAAGGAAHAREVVNINRNWQFSHTADLRSRTTVDLPHTWNYDAVGAHLLYSRGLGNYIKDITIPDEWSGKKIYIRFYGVGSEANLFVNGRFAGEHKGGYTAFTIEITPLLRSGMNNLWVRVNNAPQLDYMPLNSDFNLYGGIFRDVELIAVDPVHFSLDNLGSDGIFLSQTRVSDQEARIDAKVDIRAPKNTGYTLTIDVVDPERDSVVLSVTEKIKTDKGRGSGNVPLVLPEPHLWDGTRDPFRYDFRVTLGDGANRTDSIRISMGLRYYELHPEQGFLLNGRAYPLRGVTRYEDRAGAGSAYLNRMHEEDLALIREMGANAVRMTNYPQSPLFYELCDRYGLIVWSEIPFTAPEFGVDNGYIDKPSFRENGMTQLSEMILQHYNNTSVLFRGLFSNLPVGGADDPAQYIRQLNEHAKTLDPTRITVASSNQDGPINFITDAIGWSQYLGWREGSPSDIDIWLAQLTRNWKELKSAVGEYGAGGSILHQTDTLRRPDPRERLHPERWQTRYHETVYPILTQYPSLWGSFIHSMFDFGQVNYRGGDTPGVNNFGLVSYNRKEKKDAFYFYKANWNSTDSFVHIAEKRWDERLSLIQTVTAYSNLPEAELFVNGISQGKRAGVKNSIFRWENVSMQEGVNRLEVVAGDRVDRVQITIRQPQRIR